MERVLVVSDWSARPYLNVAGPTRKIQSSSKLRQVRAEIPDTPLGLTGIGTYLYGTWNRLATGVRHCHPKWHQLSAKFGWGHTLPQRQYCSRHVTILPLHCLSVRQLSSR